MNQNAQPRDLIILVADKNMEFAIKGLLTRPQSLNIRKINTQIYVHPERDPGCYRTAHQFLKSFSNSFNHALVLFDRNGCGNHNNSRTQLQEEVNTRLTNNGWGDRAATIVLDPELEIWVWSDSPEVDRILGWKNHNTDLRNWLHEKNLWNENDLKPADPKKAMEAALKKVNKPRSSAVFSELAKTVGLRRCTDLSFRLFCETLQHWFPRSV